MVILIPVVAVGCVMVGGGLVASADGEDRIGILTALAGAAWLAERLLQAIPTSVTGTLGVLLTGLWGAFLAHAVLAFLSGRLTSSFERCLVIAGYLVNGLLNLPPLAHLRQRTSS